MSRRRLAFASIAVVTVLCVVGVSVLAVAAGGSALAYEVNGTRVSQHDFDQLLEDISNTKGVNQDSQPDGSVSSQASASVMTTSILRDLVKGVADQRGVKVADDDRAAGTQAAQGQLGANFDKVPASYRALLVDVFAHTNALGLKDANSLNAFVARQVRKADVRVDPRYGFWNPKVGVCPPTGCQSLSNTGG